MSSIVNVAVVLEALPHSSVAVKVTVALPVAPQSSDNPVKSLVHVMLPQRSVAKAPPLDANHSSRSSVFPCPSHSTVRLDACTSITGELVSSIVNVAVVEVALPHSSVAVKVTVAEPVAPHAFVRHLDLPLSGCDYRCCR